MKKILIRADGGQKIGMGHIMRTSVLCKELKNNFAVEYICSTDESFKGGINYLESKGISVIKYDGNIFSAMENISADLLITDSYEADSFYLDETKKIFPYTMIFDDNNTFSYYNTDIILNQNIGAQNYEYNSKLGAIKLLGCKYAILRKPFRGEKIKKDFSSVKNILLTMGGADPTGATEKIISFVGDMKEFNFHTVVGNSFSNKDKIKRLESDTVKIYFNPDMFQLMNKCDVAISSCGSTIYELASLGIPTIGIVTADNQIKSSVHMAKNGLIVLAGMDKVLCKKYFTEMLKEFVGNKILLSYLSDSASEAIDGMGVYRIVESIEKMGCK